MIIITIILYFNLSTFTYWGQNYYYYYYYYFYYYNYHYYIYLFIFLVVLLYFIHKNRDMYIVCKFYNSYLLEIF